MAQCNASHATHLDEAVYKSAVGAVAEARHCRDELPCLRIPQQPGPERLGSRMVGFRIAGLHVFVMAVCVCVRACACAVIVQHQATRGYTHQCCYSAPNEPVVACRALPKHVSRHYKGWRMVDQGSVVYGGHGRTVWRMTMFHVAAVQSEACNGSLRCTALSLSNRRRWSLLEKARSSISFLAAANSSTKSSKSA